MNMKTRLLIAYLILMAAIGAALGIVLWIEILYSLAALAASAPSI